MVAPACSLSHLELGHITSDSLHDPDTFMSQNNTILHICHIAGTDTGVCDSNKNLLRAELRLLRETSLDRPFNPTEDGILGRHTGDFKLTLAGPIERRCSSHRTVERV